MTELKHNLLVTGFLVFLSSCKPSKEQMILKKWQAVSVESPGMEKMIEESRSFYDTIGKSTSRAQNLAIYGVSNMDSFRTILMAQLDSLVNQQNQTVQNTWLEFMRDSTVAAAFGSAPDTIKWYFDDEGNLMLDEMEQKGTGSRIKMEVLKLEDSVLQLRFVESNFTSVATFKPVARQ